MSGGRLVVDWNNLSGGVKPPSHQGRASKTAVYGKVAVVSQTRSSETV